MNVEERIQLYLRTLDSHVKARAAAKLLRQAVAEIARLKRGDFTEEEFQNLCHNFSTDDRCRFEQGCKDYQDNLFGKTVQNEQ